jgi:hypothetical protein
MGETLRLSASIKTADPAIPPALHNDRKINAAGTLSSAGHGIDLSADPDNPSGG